MTIGTINMDTAGWRTVDIKGAMDMPSRADEPYHDWGDEWEMNTDIVSQQHNPRDFACRVIYDRRHGGLTWEQAAQLIVDEMEGGANVRIAPTTAGGGIFDRYSDLLGIDVYGKETDMVRMMEITFREGDPQFYYAGYANVPVSDYELTTVYGSHSFKTFNVYVTGISGKDGFQGFMPAEIKTLVGNQKYSTRKARKYIVVSCIMGIRGDTNNGINWDLMVYLARFQHRLRGIPDGSVILDNKYYPKAVVENGFKVKHLRNGIATFDITFTILP